MEATPAQLGGHNTCLKNWGCACTGLNVLALINSHAAAALQYGIDRDFTNKTEWVVLYDMGATSTEAALVKFSSFTVKEAGKPKTHRSVINLQPLPALNIRAAPSSPSLASQSFS
jgi:hypothetical protein